MSTYYAVVSQLGFVGVWGEMQQSGPRGGDERMINDLSRKRAT
jgi:hypothetical protein